MNKLYYSISEVSQIVGEPQYVLRYWEKEFPLLKPKKNRAGNRIYSEKDIEIVRTIKTLLREQKLSLKGATLELEKIYGKKIKLLEKTKTEDKEFFKPKQEKFIDHKPNLFDFDQTYKINLKDIRRNLISILEIVKKL
ncbi:MerR family transcriptional regulator [Bacteroidetes/Chlorobi group bacterium MS-B_bin-24]|jgi:DNA-binding transcriptional MerR regulator|nr:MAG: MerR family transcriptional regulator [Bacteroidetes/Chlorobi group bacterium MS-B_bin-24]